jgi:hypothetical protein
VSRLPACLIVAALLTACNSQAPTAAPTATASAYGASASASAAPSPAATSTASSGGASAVNESTDLYEFDYSYPVEAGRIRALKAWLEEDRGKARKDLIEQAREGRALAKENGFEYHPYASGRVWEKVTETPRFLSLSAAIYDYTGGAHPNHGYDSLLFDKQAGTRLAPLALFASPGAFDAEIKPRFCAALDKERSKRRGEPVASDGSLFNDCIKPSEQTVILGSSSGRTFDKVGILIAPYAAGPYVEGDYEFTLPVTPALIRAVKPEYRAAFLTR